MKIFAVKDRLIDYYMTPFVARDEKEVLAAIAQVINTEPYKDAIAQAPHHFEVWRLGEIDEQGHITNRPELLAGCESLVRNRQRSPEGREIAEQLPNPPRGSGGPQRASERVIENGASAEVGPGKGPYGPAPGVPEGA